VVDQAQAWVLAHQGPQFGLGAVARTVIDLNDLKRGISGEQPLDFRNQRRDIACLVARRHNDREAGSFGRRRRWNGTRHWRVRYRPYQFVDAAADRIGKAMRRDETRLVGLARAWMDTRFMRPSASGLFDAATLRASDRQSHRYRNRTQARVMRTTGARTAPRMHRSPRRRSRRSDNGPKPQPG